MQARVADLTGLVGSARLDPGRRGLVAVGLVAVLVAAVVGGWVLTSRPHQLPVASAGPVSGESSVSAGGSLQSPLAGPVSPTPAGSSVVVVDVAGKVCHPGVFRLSSGARVADAVNAAGGMLPGVDPITVNLARKLADGEQLVIGPPPPVVSGSADSGSSSSGSSSGLDSGGSGSGNGLVDLNTASADQLDSLPGVGPVLAQRIVDWRTQHGRFDTIDQLNDVSGIGDAKFADLKALVTV